MIRALLLGCARVLFSLAVISGIITALLLYASWRTLKRVTVGAAPPAKREAAFGVLIALVALARAANVQLPAEPFSRGNDLETL